MDSHVETWKETMKAETHTDWTIWLSQQRRIVTNILIWFILILGFIGITASVARVIRNRVITFNLIYYILSYALVLVLFLVRKIPDVWRSYGFVLLLYTFGALAMYSGWLAGGGRVFLLATIVVSAILVSPRASIYTAILVFLTYLCFGLLFNCGVLELGRLPDPTTTSPVIIEGIGFVMNIIMVTGSLWFFGKALMAADKANREAQEARSLLAVQAKELEEANQLIAQQSEEALRYSEEKFRNVVQQAIDAIVLCNEQGLVTDWNQAAEQITGIKKDEAVGSHYWDIQMKMLPNERRSKTNLKTLRSSMTNVFRTGDAPWLNRLIDVQIQHQDESRRFIQQVAFPIRTVKGFMLGSIIRDITNQKQIEIERESLIRKLESQNAELERFTYTVSHDLKAPLVTIRGYLGYLEKDAKNGNLDRMEDDIRRIERATDRMQILLKDLLELSRIGRLMNPAVEIEFGTLAREVVDMVTGALDAKGVQVVIAPDLPSVYGDRQRLLEVVQNLVDNAAKFMGDQPDPRIEIGQRGEEDDEPIFFVRDNGIGIAPEYHEEVFGLFNKLNPKIDGTGVGLALVKRIIEFHGGRIWVESEAGKGSTFYFTLPTK